MHYGWRRIYKLTLVDEAPEAFGYAMVTLHENAESVLREITYHRKKNPQYRAYWAQVDSKTSPAPGNGRGH